MRRRPLGVLAITLLGLVASSLYVPVGYAAPAHPVAESTWIHDVYGSWYAWVWERERFVFAVSNASIEIPTRLRWGQLAAIQAAILLIGGGPLTWAVRRERRQPREVPE